MPPLGATQICGAVTYLPGAQEGMVVNLGNCRRVPYIYFVVVKRAAQYLAKAMFVGDIWSFPKMRGPQYRP